jgi:integrase
MLYNFSTRYRNLQETLTTYATQYNKSYKKNFLYGGEIMSLTEVLIRQAKPEEKTYMLSDGHGLGLEIRPDGKKYWIIRYWINKKEHRTSVGAYPGVTLKEAREKNVALRKALKTGKPVGIEVETFATVAEEWLEKRMVPKCAGNYLQTLRRYLARLIIPFIGHMKLDDITAGVILQICRRIEARGTLETASIVKQIIGQIFNYAIATTRAEINPTLALRGALQTRKEKHYATITEPDKIAILVRQIDAYPYVITRCALKFSMLTFCRPGEVRAAEWKEINWEKAEWHIPIERMKMKLPHIVPLARQVVSILEELQPITGHQRWLFPSARNDGRCMSDHTIRAALGALGYSNNDIVPHGFRSMASTILNENGFPPDLIERQLAHSEKNTVRAAYNHAEYLPKRREMMAWWANWLDEMKNIKKENQI